MTEGVVRVHKRMWLPYCINCHVGATNKDGEGVRRWVHWLSTNNPNTLWLHDVGTRRQAEWDDHGEAYARNVNGPDLMIVVKVPLGLHDVSLYFFNKDGRTALNRRRDFHVEVTRYCKSASRMSKIEEHEYPVPTGEVLARTRVKDFWNGVYKTFRVEGGSEYLFRIKRQGSLNVIVSRDGK